LRQRDQLLVIGRGRASRAVPTRDRRASALGLGSHARALAAAQEHERHVVIIV